MAWIQDAPAEGKAARRARYAARDVLDKLGLRPGLAIRLSGVLDPDLAVRARARVGRGEAAPGEQVDLILFWPSGVDGLTPTLGKFKSELTPAGGIWVVSAKRQVLHPRGVPYLPDTVLIPSGLAAGLVDNKVCSVSATETAMRFVLRLADRRKIQ